MQLHRATSTQVGKCCDVWLALLGLEILVEGLIQSWLLWWSGQGNSTDLCKRTPREEKEAKSKEKIRVSKTY